MRDVGAGHIGVCGRFEVGIDLRREPWPGELTIEAGPDSTILVADELLWRMLKHPEDVHPDVEFEFDDGNFCSCPMLNGRECFHGSIMRFKTTDGTVIYRVGEYEPVRNAWWARWPD
jgi:hypothetical protein